jgi:hypothetical protein
MPMSVATNPGQSSLKNEATIILGGLSGSSDDKELLEG